MCEITCIDAFEGGFLSACDGMVVHPNNAHRLVVNATNSMHEASVSTTTKSTTQQVIIHCYSRYSCMYSKFEHNGERFELYAYGISTGDGVDIRTSWETKSYIYCIGSWACGSLTFSGFSSSSDIEQIGELSVFCTGIDE